MEFLPAFLLALVIGFIVFVPFTTVFRKLTQPSKTWLSCLLDALLELPQLLRLGKFARDNDINEALRTAVVATGLRDLTLPEEDLSFVSRYVETRRVGRERLSVSYSPSGYLMVQEMLHRRMCTRLRFVDYLQHHPEVGRVALKDPIFVIGFPRTGTTFLHELLGLHPGVRMHYTWEQIDPVPHAYLHASKAAEPDTCDPAPSPSSSPLPSGPELAVMQADRRMRFDSFRTRFRVITALLGEQVQSIHRIGYTEPEECTTPCSMELPWAIPELLYHIASADETMHTGCGGAFRYYRKFLQLLTWQNPGNVVLAEGAGGAAVAADVPGASAGASADGGDGAGADGGDAPRYADQWMLKCPFHLPYLDALMREFPGSTIVWTHRDPVECVASACSLYETLAALCIEVPTLDRKAMGRCVLDYTHAALTRAGDAIAAAERARGAGKGTAKGTAKVGAAKGKGSGKDDVAGPSTNSTDSNVTSSSSEPVMHIRYADNVRDPVSVCRSIFLRAGMTDAAQTAEWERRVAHYLEKNRREREAKRGKESALHAYSLADYGLTEEGVRERFRDYTDKYGLVAAK